MYDGVVIEESTGSYTGGAYWYASENCSEASLSEGTRISAVIEADEAIYQARRALREAERSHMGAQRRSLRTLLEFLDASQREQFVRDEYFEVVNEGGRFRIHQHTVENIRCVAGRFRERIFCISSHARLPVWDVLLIQKVMLECDFERFLEIANY